MPDKLVVAYCYSSFNISGWPTEIEGQDIAEWVDIAVGDYGWSTSPMGNMTQKQCSAISMEFNRGTGGNFTSVVAERTDDRQGLVHGLRARPVEEYQRQGE